MEPVEIAVGGRLERRAVLRLLVTGAGVALLAACTPTPAAPTSAPAPKPTEPPKPVVATPAPTAPVAQPTVVAPPVAAAKPTVLVPAATAAKPVAQPRNGGVLRMAILGDLPNLESHLLNQNAYDTLWQAFDRLTAYDPQLKPQPMLAESWELSPDLKRVKLNLRRGVQFHSGREFTSDDVKWNLLRPRDPKLQTGSAFGTQSNWFSSIDTPDKYTVVLESEQARPALFDFFEFFNILDRVSMEGPDAKSTAIGTGPFTFAEWVQGDHIKLTKNKNYWQNGRPYLDEIMVSVIADAQTAITQTEAGAIDALKTPPLRDFVRLKADPKFQAFVNPLSGQNYLVGLNTLNAPLDNRKVRQALFWAIDRKRFSESVMLGIVQPKSLPWGNMNSPAYDAAKAGFFSFDLNKAKSLLEEANVSDLEIDIDVISFEPEMSDFALIYQADLAKIGVKLNVRKLEIAVWNDMVLNKKYVGAYATAGTYSQMEPITQFTNSGAFNPNSNNEGFKNDRYSELVSSAASEPDLAKRKQLYAQLNDLLLDEAFVSPISAAPTRWVARANVHDIGFTLHEACVWTNAWVDA
jgi:peptide/nickel transport system substrate-binding protein